MSEFDRIVRGGRPRKTILMDAIAFDLEKKLFLEVLLDIRDEIRLSRMEQRDEADYSPPY